MNILTNSRLRISSYLLIGAMALTSLLPKPSLNAFGMGPYIDRGWLHFIVYATAATLCLIAWKRSVGLVLAFGLCFLSVVLQVLRAQIAGLWIDYFGMAVNLLGIAAGILLGLNIISSRSRSKPQDQSRPDRSHSTLT